MWPSHRLSWITWTCTKASWRKSIPCGLGSEPSKQPTRIVNAYNTMPRMRPFDYSNGIYCYKKTLTKSKIDPTTLQSPTQWLKTFTPKPEGTFWISSDIQVKCYDKINLSTQLFLQCPPGCRSELKGSNGDNRNWNPMMMNNLLNIGTVINP